MEKEKTHLDELIEMMESSYNDPENELTTLEQWLRIPSRCARLKRF